MRSLHRTVPLVLLGLLACDAESPGPLAPNIPLDEATGYARSFGMWAPYGPDTCTSEIHDRYVTVGPDGLVYPTWHPPVDPATGCTFGHEHGRDPAGSDLHALVGDIPFGYANEHLEASGFGAPRHEDHVGHKVEWENDLQMRIGDGGDAVLDITCDVLVKLHQGTHSPDAFTNNLHEVVYHIRCSDGTGFSATLLTPIGDAGEFVTGCDRDLHIQAGTATPAISPDGGGKRALPTAACVDDGIVNSDRPRFDGSLRESWEISGRLRRADGRTLVAFNPYFQVLDPSRYFDPAVERSLARSVDLCARPLIMGRDRCEELGDAIPSWDAVRSPFKGTRRFVDINSNRVDNAGGANIWYTDPLGRNGRTEPFSGSIRQWVADRDNTAFDLRGPVIGKDRDYDDQGVHAPN